MKKILFLFSIALTFYGCVKKSNELGKNSFYFEFNGKEIVPEKYVGAWNMQPPVEFFIDGTSLELNVIHIEDDLNLQMNVIIHNFNGPGIYHFKTYPSQNPTDNYVKLTLHTGSYHSIDISPETYFRVLEYQPNKFIRGIFHFVLYNNQNNKVNIDKGRFDWWQLN